MNTFLWVLQGLLAAFFILPGVGKIRSSREKHIADGHIEPDGAILPIRLLGVLELLGCIGIIVPWLTGVAPVLTPVAAVGFGVIMAAGLLIHVRRKEYQMLPMLVTVLLAASLVAYYRFASVHS